MILVIEPVCQDLEHAAFNGAMLLCAHHLAGSDAVEFHAEPAHLQAVAETLGGRMSEQLAMHPLQTAPRHANTPGQRLWRDFSALLAVVKQPRAQPPSLVIITCVTEDTLLAAKILFGLRFPRLPVLVVLHSVLHNLLYSRKRRLLMGVGTPPRMRMLVLGQHIRQRLQQLYPWLAEHVCAIRHPYAFEAPRAQLPRQPLIGPPRFGFVGLGNQAKGFDVFLAVIEALGARHPRRLAGCFHLIGRVHPHLQPRFEAFCQGPHGHLIDAGAGPKLPLADFQAAVCRMDYLVMPYDAGMYDLVCSGSSLDAFAYLRPVIVLRSRYFDGLFADAGDIGYLCDTAEELTDRIEALAISTEPERHSAQQQNLLRGRALFEPGAVAEELRRLTTR